MKIFFVEGVDGSGKTTLISKLSAISGVISCTPPPRDWDYFIEMGELYEMFLNKIVKHNYNTENTILIDRGPISEFIYRGIIDEEKPKMTFAQFADLMAKYPIGIIYCKTDRAFIRAQARGEMIVKNLDVHKQLEERYEQFMSTMKIFGINVITVNNNTTFIQETVQNLYSLIKMGGA